MQLLPKQSDPEGSQNIKTRNQYLIPGFEEKFGGVLLSHPASRAVPSALKSLTSVFGMGTGVASSLLPPKNEYAFLLLNDLDSRKNSIWRVYSAIVFIIL